ncbi:MAG: SDR family oxidoreductase [Armatimonadota bacterium]
MSLSGKVAIVTGAGRGIGRAVAERFVKDGARVALVARSAEVLVAAEACGGLGIRADIASERDVEALFSRVDAELGPVDILVNNAGVMILAPLAETGTDEWRRVMETNVTGSFLCARAALARMMPRRTGRIINVGSLAGRRGYPEQGAYCTSKHALVGLTKVLALEAQPYGIRVNMVSPGGVHTELSAPLLSTRPASEAAEWMSVEEVADGICYIASQEGPATTDELVLRRFASEPWR